MSFQRDIQYIPRANGLEHTGMMINAHARINWNVALTTDLKTPVIKFYTGLPSYACLMAVFNFVSADLKEHHNLNLTLFQQFLVKKKLEISSLEGDGTHKSFCDI